MNRLGITLLFVMTIMASGLTWATATDLFQAGIKAFRSGDYVEALGAFVAARDSGMRAPTLHYNLGATHYKLGEYGAAMAEFAAIENDPSWGALAHYNLGLIDQKLGNLDRAEEHFRAAKQQATSDKLRQMADAMLAPRDGEVHTASVASRWTSYVSLGTGFDDNVILADDATLAAVSDEGDYFLDGAAAVSRYLSGSVTNGWRLDLSGYYRAHADLDDFDFGTASAALNYNRLAGDWHFQVGVRGDVQLAGGDYYTSGATLRARAYHRIGEVGLRVTNDFGLVRGASEYSYLDGTQNRLTLELIRRWDRLEGRAGYQLEINDRDDLALPAEFYSYSPTRHGIFGTVEAPFSDRLSGEARLEFRHSDYPEDNVELEVDGTVTRGERDAGYVSATLRLAYRLTERWQLVGEYQYSDNDSDLGRYSYGSNRYRVGVESAR